MRTLPVRRAPLWFVGLLAALCACALRSVMPATGASPVAGVDSAPVSLAFWAFFVVIAEALWKGVEVAGRIALAVLQYSVKILWRAVVLIAKGARELAGYAWKGLRKAWDLLRLTYDKVLKPAWKAVWKFVDRTEAWLKRTFGPLMKWLRRVQKWVLDFYKDYVRPILDVIDISRMALRALASLGLEWARALDAKLGEIQEAIDRPFRLLLAKINEVVNLVNRVITADGLFQKLAHVRSIERDIREVSRAFANWRSVDVTPAEIDATQKRLDERSVDDIVRDGTVILLEGGGKYAGLVDELVAQGTANLRLR